MNCALSLEGQSGTTLSFLPSGWKLKTLTSSKETLSFYDTFEWHAFANGIAIMKKKNILTLADLTTGHNVTSVPLRGKPSSFFANALPGSNLKERLCSCSSLRAFIRRCTLDVHAHSFRLVDDNEKTVAVLSTESMGTSSINSIHVITLAPLKGYEEEIAPFRQVLGTLKERIRVLDFRELYTLIMKGSGHTVEDYSSKIHLTLDPDAPIHESTRRLLQFTFSVMCRNEEGIRKNIDSEFLHDYRVAIRRTRSILKQLDGVFDEKETAYFLAFFKDLCKRTNDLRDRDVYLLRHATWFNYLPPALRPALPVFFGEISTSRKAQHIKFCRYLSSTTCQTFLEKWDSFLNRSAPFEPEHAPEALLPTMSMAIKSIKKAWKKVLCHGRQISRETTDGELHALRIDCKKLRYLLEFFASVFPYKTITPVIRQLKELQENLGEFVDFSVQLCFLDEKLASMPADKLLAASIGGLMATLFQKKEEARLKFHNTFRSFDHEETSRLFQELLTETRS